MEKPLCINSQYVVDFSEAAPLTTPEAPEGQRMSSTKAKTLRGIGPASFEEDSYCTFGLHISIISRYPLSVEGRCHQLQRRHQRLRIGGGLAKGLAAALQRLGLMPRASEKF